MEETVPSFLIEEEFGEGEPTVSTAALGGSSAAETTGEMASPAPKIPVTIQRTKFDCFNRSETSQDGLYKLIAHQITPGEFASFCALNAQSRHKYMLLGTDILMPIYQANNESIIHKMTSSWFAHLFMQYDNTLGGNILACPSTCAVQYGNFSRQPDFSAYLLDRQDRISNANLVGEIMFSQPLADGHAFAQRYLSKLSDVCSVVLIALQYPLEIDPTTGRYITNITSTYYLYLRPPAGHTGNIAPAVVTSFGQLPIGAEEVQRICEVTGCTAATVGGYRYDNLVPCNAANLPQYRMHIPSHVFLRLNPNDAVVTVNGVVHPLNAIPAEWGFYVDLYSIQTKFTPAIRTMSTRTFGPVPP